MAHKPGAPASKSVQLTSTEMHEAIARLQRRLSELQAFPVVHLDGAADPRLRALEQAIDKALVGIFGTDTVENARYREAAQLGPFSCGLPWNEAMGRDALIEFVQRNLSSSAACLMGIVKGFEEDLEFTNSEPAGNHSEAPACSASKRIFVVHGRDDGPREAVARFLERIGFEPIILHEQANQGRTVIEKNRGACRRRVRGSFADPG